MLLRARGNLSNYLKTGQNTSINFDVAVKDSFTEDKGSSVPVLAADLLEQLTFSRRAERPARVCAFLTLDLLHSPIWSEAGLLSIVTKY